jgi:transposase-like protein
MSSHLSNPIFHNEDAARAWFEARIWPNGPFCPHCGEVENITRLHGKGGAKGTKARPGLIQCNACREQFTVTVNTVCERSKIPLSKWCMAIYLINASKKGMSALQMHRMMGGSYKTAWFMMHRIREVMREGKLGPLGGGGKYVEADETYVGGKAKNRAYKAPPKKEAVMALVERQGKVVSVHVPNVTAKTLRPLIVSIVDRKSHLRTDHSPVYWTIGDEYKTHYTVNHSADEYVRGDASTNSVESYFAVLKRGIFGIYHSVSEEHLKRYLCEFDFRYNYRSALGYTDMERAEIAAAGIYGKRLTYRRPDNRPNV